MLSWDKDHVVALCGSTNHARYRRFHLPANTVAGYRFAVFFANGKANSTLLDIWFVSAVKHDKVLVRNAFRVLIDVVVLIVFF